MKVGWRKTTLGDACRFIDYRGKTPTKIDTGLRLITAKNVKMGFVQRDPLEYVSPDSYEGWMTRGIPKFGDVLFTTEAPLANVAQLDTDERVVFAQRIIVLQPSDESLDRTFLKYQLLSDILQDRIRENGTGATVQGIKASLLKAIEIAVPPLAEQQRIVGILDEAFEGIATAKANIEKNLQNAHALFESHLQSVFTQRGESWQETTVGEEIDLLAGFAFKSKNYTNTENDVRLLRGDNIIPGCLRWDDVKRWPASDTAEYERYLLGEGDVVLAMDRPWIKAGLKHATIAADDLPCLLVQRTASPWRSQLGQPLPEVTDWQFGIHDPYFGRSDWERRPAYQWPADQRLPIALPPLSEQRRIASNLESVAEETQRLATIYERKLAALDELKKSLLHQAFSGNL